MKKVRSKLRPTQIGVIKTFSLSPNDEIGEIAVECTGCTYYYSSLEELCEKWQDYEEPKEDYIRVIESFIHYAEEADDSFYCDESVKKFIEKLKAWNRLESVGFKFKGWKTADLGADKYYFVITAESDGAAFDDLDLLFGGEA